MVEHNQLTNDENYKSDCNVHGIQLFGYHLDRLLIILFAKLLSLFEDFDSTSPYPSSDQWSKEMIYAIPIQGIYISLLLKSIYVVVIYIPVEFVNLNIYT